MKAISSAMTSDILKPIQEPLSKKDQIIKYYEEAGRDYGTWSKKFNMHFGYYQNGMNPFRREAMLDNLNENVLGRLQINPSASPTIADFGCGLGATLRHGIKKYPKANFKGITIVPWQVQHANQLNSQLGSAPVIEIIEGDYCKTRFESNSLDGVIAIESSCYASGANKSDLLKEIHRVLKPGGRFTISDGFIKRSIPEKGFLRNVYAQLCNSWALTELGNIHDVQRYLEHLNFTDLRVEEISMNVAPSVAHVPFTVVYFLIKELLFGKEPMTKERWDNIKSPLLTMILGSARGHFGYYLVSGTKTAEESMVHGQ